MAREPSKRVLDPIHQSAMRIATGAFRTSPTTDLLVEAHEAPLVLRRVGLAMRFCCKLAHHPMHPTRSLVFSPQLVELARCRPGRQHRLFCSQMASWMDASNLCIDQIHVSKYRGVAPWRLQHHRIDVSLSVVPKHQSLPTVLLADTVEHINMYADHTPVYTDGSRSPSGVGCAFVSGSTTRSFRLPNDASVFITELYAIVLALIFIRSHASSRFLILTDSLSALLAFDPFYLSSHYSHHLFFL